MKFYTAGIRGDVHEDRYVVPQVLVCEKNGKTARITFLRFIRRNGITLEVQEVVVTATDVQSPHEGPYITQSKAAMDATRVRELAVLPFEYSTSKHGSFKRDPDEVG